MGIYIRGMEMPKVPGVYSLDLYVDEICQIQNLDGGTFEAIEVPPHGDLIDRDVLEHDAQKRLLMCSKYGDQFQKPYEVMRAIDNAPTIIGAEEVYGRHSDTAGNFHWCGTHSGEHVINAEPCNDLAKPNSNIFAVQNADEDEGLFAAKPIDYMHTPSVEEIIKGDGE